MSTADWIARIHSDDGHIVAFKEFRNMTQEEASAKAQQWAEALGKEDYTLSPL